MATSYSATVPTSIAVGKSRSYDGSAGDNLGTSPLYAAGATVLTVSFWCKNSLASYAGGLQIALDDGGGGPTSGGFYIGFRPEYGMEVCVGTTVTGPDYFIRLNHFYSAVDADDEWRCFVVSYDATNFIRAWLNAEELTITDSLYGGTGDYKPVNAALFAGSSNAGGFKFTGLLDDVRIYDRLLTQAEIDDLYANGPTLSGDYLAHYTFDDELVNNLMAYSATVPTVVATGKSASFTGSSRFLLDTEAGYTHSAISLAVSVWIKCAIADFDNALAYALDSCNENPSAGGFYLALDDRDSASRTGAVVLGVGTATDTYKGKVYQNVIDANSVWRHFLFGYGATGGLQLWVNSVAKTADATVGDGSGNYVPLNSRIAVGGTTAGISLFTGLIDDVRIFSAEPSQALADALYAHTSTTAALRHYTFDDTPESEYVDITAPLSYHTYQRDGSDQATITIGAKCAGALQCAVKWGGAWSNVTPTNHRYSGTLAAQAAGQNTFEMRRGSGSGYDSSAYVGIGDVFLIGGQSNAMGHALEAQTYSAPAGAPTLKATVYGSNLAWRECTDHTDDSHNVASVGSAWPLLATLIMAETELPVAFITAGYDGGGLVNGTEWTKNNAAYASCVAMVAGAASGGVKALLWHQGESDALNDVSQADYQTALSAMLDNLQTDTGLTTLKLLCAQIGRLWSEGKTLNEIRAAQQYAIDNDADILWGPVLHDCVLSEDNLHWRTNAEMAQLSNRWWRSVAYHYYSGSAGAAARFSRVRYHGARVYVETSGGVLPWVSADTTGWSVTDGDGARTVGSVLVRGKVIILTCDQELTAPVSVSYGDYAAAVGATLADSGAVPYPLSPFVGESATAGVLGGRKVGLLIPW